LRYGILNQGIQELRVRVPDHWKNIEFTGPGIRRKDKQEKDWVIGLQDKAWGGYTLVITYDFPFDPKGGTLSIGGAHALNVERENGSIAITSASGMQLKPANATEALRRIDEAELAAGDRSLITRPVLFAYQYAGDSYRLSVDVRRYDELPVLEAVADRIQLTTALTEDGQMLTQASFMVKNNAKQYQRFRLPGGAEFWSCYVNDQPAKAERDGEWLLVPLPQGANRDQAFAVDLVYAQKLSSSPAWRPGKLFLEAPGTDVPNTYAEWQLYVRPSQHLGGFGGSMTVAPGAVYEWRDAWKDFLVHYRLVMGQGGAVFIGAVGFVVILALMFIAGIRRGWNGVAVFLVLLCAAIIMAGMLLPSLAKAKAKAQTSRAASAMDGRAAGVPASARSSPEPQQEMDALNIQLPVPAFMGTPTDLSLAAEPEGTVKDSKPSMVLAGRSELRREAKESPVQNNSTRMAVRLVENAPAVRGPGAGGAGGMAAATATAAGAVPPQAPATPMAAGVRPIRIEIPRDGAAFSFTKVLNTGEEPLTISARIMAASSFLRWRGIAQVAVFLAGCVILLRQWHAGKWNSLILLMALLFIGGSVGHFLLSHRLLDLALIVAAPVFLFVVIVWFLWLLWPKRKAAPPIIAASLLLLLASNAQGETGVVSADTRPSNSGAVVLSTSLEGQVQDGTVLFDAALRLSFSKTNQVFALFDNDIAIQQFQAEPAQAQLWRQGRFVCVYFPGTGEVAVRLKGLARLGGDVSQRQLKLRTPPALYTHLSLSLDEPDAEV
jgi:hypothetical protein